MTKSRQLSILLIALPFALHLWSYWARFLGSIIGFQIPIHTAGNFVMIAFGIVSFAIFLAALWKASHPKLIDRTIAVFSFLICWGLTFL